MNRSVRAASQGAALLIGIPLVFAAFDIPTEAMNVDRFTASRVGRRVLAVPAARPAKPRPTAASAQLPIFTTRAVRDQFLTDPPPRTLTLDVFKEEYFASQVPFGRIIYREARRHGLAPELVAAMVHTESDFRPGLVSNKEAQGLMQIVPSTARLLGIRDPFDPEENIAAGTRYFRYLLNRFENEKVALAAYNAGEGNVARFGGIPPFDETRNYVDRVLRRTSTYRQGVRNTYLATLKLRHRDH